MKLTADMFDFEKYEYRWGYPTMADEIRGYDSWVTPDLASATTTLLRTPKPSPRYILLNAGEMLQSGDEYHSGYAHGWQKRSSVAPVRATVLPGEIWRRIGREWSRGA